MPFGDEAAAGSRRYLADGRPALARRRGRRRGCSSTPAGGALSRMGFWKILRGYGGAGRHRPGHLAPRAAALVCDASARTRRRPARHPDDARPRRPVDDADLHPRARRAAALGLRAVPPAPVMSRATSRTAGARRRAGSPCAVAAWIVVVAAARPCRPPARGRGDRRARGLSRAHARAPTAPASVEDVAAAAARRAGLAAVIVTDHGDGTRASGPAALRRRRAGHRRRRSEHLGRALRRPRRGAVAVSARRRTRRRWSRTCDGSAASVSSRTPGRRKTDLKWRDWDARVRRARMAERRQRVAGPAAGSAGARSSPIRWRPAEPPSRRCSIGRRSSSSSGTG